MNDILKEHLETDFNSTLDGLDMLHLPHTSDFCFAANTYLEALNELAALRERLAQVKRVLQQVKAIPAKSIDGEWLIRELEAALEPTK